MREMVGNGGGLLTEELLVWRVEGEARQVACRLAVLKWGQQVPLKMS